MVRYLLFDSRHESSERLIINVQWRRSPPGEKIQLFPVLGPLFVSFKLSFSWFSMRKLHNDPTLQHEEAIIDNR